MKSHHEQQWKEVSITLVMGIVSYVLGYMFARFIHQEEYISLIYGSCVAIFFIAVFFLQVVLIKRTTYASFLIFGESALMTLPLFLGGKSLWPLFIGGVTALLLFSTHMSGRKSVENMLEMKLWGLRRHIMGSIFFAITFFIVFNYMIALNENNLMISRRGVEIIFVPFESIARRYLPDLSSKSSVREVLEGLTRSTQKSQLEKIPLEEQQGAIDRAVSDVRDTINSSLNAHIKLNENIIDAIHESINAFIRNAPEHLKQTIVIVITILLLLTVGGGGYIISGLAGIIAWVLYELLLASGFVYSTVKDTQQEIIKLDK